MQAPAADVVGTGPARAWGTPGRWALLLGGLGVLYRLALLPAHVPPTNSDEATMGLAALRIAAGAGHPVFFYGQRYMGTVEAYLAAPLVALSGPSVTALRLPTLALYALFLAVMYRLTVRLYRPWLAVAVVGLLALGADRVVKNELIAAGGYPEINPAGAALLLLAVGLSAGAYRYRRLALAGWGLLAGFCVWDDWLVLPYVAAAGAVLLAYARRDLLGPGGAAVVLGVLAGATPAVAGQLTAPPGHGMLAAFLQLNQSTRAVGWADRLHGSVLRGVPLGLGLCSPGYCAPWRMAWGVLAVALLLASAVLAGTALLRAARARPVTGAPVPLAGGSASRPGGSVPLRGGSASRPGGSVAVPGGSASSGRGGGPPGGASGRPAGPGDPAAGPERVRQAGRLALALAALTSIALYARSPAAGQTPVESARYLHCVLISTPALLWPLWAPAAALARRPVAGDGRRRRVAGGVGVVLLAGLAVTALAATVSLVRAVPRIGSEAADDRALVAELRRQGLTRLYGEYNVCDRIAFATRERIVCAVLDDRLRRGQDRMPGYRERVAAADRRGYVFTAGAPIDRTFAARLRAEMVPARVDTVGRYRIYQPEVRLPDPQG